MSSKINGLKAQMLALEDLLEIKEAELLVWEGEVHSRQQKYEKQISLAKQASSRARQGPRCSLLGSIEEEDAHTPSGPSLPGSPSAQWLAERAELQENYDIYKRLDVMCANKLMDIQNVLSKVDAVTASCSPTDLCADHRADGDEQSRLFGTKNTMRRGPRSY